MDNTLLQWIITQTGLAGLAAFAIFMLTQAWKEKLELKDLARLLAEQYALTNREDKLLLLATLDKNTIERVELNGKIDTLLRKIEGSTREQRKPSS